MYSKNYKDTILKILNGELHSTDDLEITHIAFGDGTMPTTENDTQLENEVFRKVVLSQNRRADNLETLIILGLDEANDFVINEIAIFGNATITVNSGVLLSRIVLVTPLPKNSANEISILRKDFVSTDKEIF